MKYLICVFAISTAACAHVQEPPPNHAIDHEENLRFSINSAIQQQECMDVVSGTCLQDSQAWQCRVCLQLDQRK